MDIIPGRYYNSTFDLLLKDAEINKFGRKTELMSHAPMRSTASSSSHRGRDISDSCSTITPPAREGTFLLVVGDVAF